MADVDEVRYEPATTLFGALQRGLGRGAIRAATEAGAVEAVFRCLERDQRWDTQVEDRAVYLARLVRDLGIPVRRLLDLLGDPPGGDYRRDGEDYGRDGDGDGRDGDGDDGDDYRREETFRNVLAVVESLGIAGDGEAVDGLRRYVAEGPRWVDVLEGIAAAWPRECWDDLLPVVRVRLAADPAVNVWNERPWTDWAAADEVVGARFAVWEAGCEASRVRGAPHRAAADRLAGEPVERLLAAIRADDGPWLTALMELNRRGPEPALVPLLDVLAGRAESPGGRYATVGRAVRLLGELALPVARRWAAVPGHPMSRLAIAVVAAHGDRTDVPALFAARDRQDRDPLDHCGFDVLAEGLARIGGPEAGRAVPWLHELWVTPHSYERAAYLRALLRLDPEGAEPLFAEGLWDCEAGVRLLAVERVTSVPETYARLRCLRDDPLEDADVRAAAAIRCAQGAGGGTRRLTEGSGLGEAPADQVRR